MQTRCPHCHCPMDIVNNDSLADLTCKSCGSNFSLVGTEETIPLGELPKTIAHFELIDRIGSGAVGTVWKARDSKLDRYVALKVPRKEELTASEAERFLREARAAAQIRHPNIVGVYEVGRVDELVFMASEYIEGCNLAQLLAIERHSPLEAAAFCQKLANALNEAHLAGVVHRDLKPANILLDRNKEPHITDFGMAKRGLGEVSMTIEGRILGTPTYMSPEQARGEAHNADSRTDVYSLGVILYELLIGEPPFRGELRMLVMQILDKEPISPKSINSRIPQDLETICLKCLEKKPEKRYSSAKQLADDLGRFLSGEPIAAKPIGSIEKTWRWCQRKPVIASLSGILVSVVMTIAIASPIIATQQANLREKADNLVSEKDLLLREKETLVKKLNDSLARQKLATQKAQQLANENAIIAKYVEETIGVTKKWILKGTKAAIQPLYNRNPEPPEPPKK